MLAASLKYSNAVRDEPVDRCADGCDVAAMAGVERFANKGVGSNLVTYLTGVVGMSTAAAAKSVIAWNGVSFMLPLVSAILADSYWDRYCTIAASSLLYVFVRP